MREEVTANWRKLRNEEPQIYNLRHL